MPDSQTARFRDRSPPDRDDGGGSLNGRPTEDQSVLAISGFFIRLFSEYAGMGADAHNDALETTYEGVFGILCKHVPLFNASAPGDWHLVVRSYDLTAWHHPVSDVDLVCEKDADGWTVRIRDRGRGTTYRTLPTATNRLTAFMTVRLFFKGESLMIADDSRDEPSLVTTGPQGLEYE